MSFAANTLYYGDCLDWMRRWDDACVDLIYLDPPFNSKTDYNILYAANGGGSAQYRAFSDTWTWDEAAADRLARYEAAVGRRAHDAVMGLHRMLRQSGMLAYLTYMAERLEECRRLLKSTGSIYLHCDPTASHYLKVVMDAVFGASNFRNEIIWCYAGGGIPKSDFPRKHDVILRYSVSKTRIYNPIYRPYSAGTVQRGRTKVKGKYFDQGLRKEGTPVNDWWPDVPKITSPTDPEKLGYPTQKSVALLERIIKASSNKGDIILDPFCGCGTAIDAANRLGRRWAGIDISSFAIDLIRDRRLQDRTIPIKGIPYDLQSAIKLAQEAPFNFESWAVNRLPGFVPNTKQVADGGVDGRATLAHKPDNHPSRLAVSQVKGGKFNLSQLRDFIGVTRRDAAALGFFVTLQPIQSGAARTEVLDTGKTIVEGRPYRRTQLWSISEYFDDRLPSMPIMADPYTGKPLEQGCLF